MKVYSVFSFNQPDFSFNSVLITFSIGEDLREKKKICIVNCSKNNNMRGRAKRGEDPLCEVEIRGALGFIPVGHGKYRVKGN